MKLNFNKTQKCVPIANELSMTYDLYKYAYILIIRARYKQNRDGHLALHKKYNDPLLEYMAFMITSISRDDTSRFCDMKTNDSIIQVILPTRILVRYCG